jgi:anti-anti-sigma regulatory factor
MHLDPIIRGADDGSRIEGGRWIMEITVTQAQGKVPVTVIKTSGPLDGSNYEELIEQARRVVSAGAKDVLLDLTNTDYMSTAGVVALQSIARLLRGDSVPSPDSGWDAIHDIERTGKIKQTHLKLLNPQPKVYRSLELIGLKNYFSIFMDREKAIQSF